MEMNRRVHTFFKISPKPIEMLESIFESVRYETSLILQKQKNRKPRLFVFPSGQSRICIWRLLKVNAWS
jgi:hypothetical protein